MKSMTIEVHLKGGGSFTFEASEVTVSFDQMKWSTPEGATPRMLHVDMNEVAAVVRLK